MMRVTQRAVARGLARSASTCSAGADVGGDRLGQALQDAGQAGAAAAGAQDQVGGDQVAGGVVEFVGEGAQRVLGVPAGAQPGDQPW